MGLTSLEFGLSRASIRKSMQGSAEGLVNVGPAGQTWVFEESQFELFMIWLTSFTL